MRFAGVTQIDVSASSIEDFEMLKFGPTVNEGVMRVSSVSRFSRTAPWRRHVASFGQAVDWLSHDRSVFQVMDSTPQVCHEANRTISRLKITSVAPTGAASTRRRPFARKAEEG